jgi:hypothetical protein
MEGAPAAMPTTNLAAPPATNPGETPNVRPPVRPHQPLSINDPSVQAADTWLRRFQAAVVSIMAAAAVGVGAVAFFTSFEAIRSYAKTSGGITPPHAWAIPLLVDTFIAIATGAELWLGVQPARRAWWELAWPRALLAGAAAVSFVLNVAHAKAGDWPARGVAAIPPVALVLSVELLVMIARRAAIARTHRLTTASLASVGEATVVVRGDQATTMVASADDLRALEATSSTDHHTARANDHLGATSLVGDHQAEATGDQPPTTAAAKATSGNRATGGATYQRVRDLYLGGMTVAAEIARELGVSASYAQRTLRQVKADLARETTARPDGRATTDQPADQATSDRQPPTRSQDEQTTATERTDEATTADRDAGSTTRATTNGDGRTTTNGDRHLSLVRDQEADRGEVPSR